MSPRLEVLGEARTSSPTTAGASVTSAPRQLGQPVGRRSQRQLGLAVLGPPRWETRISARPAAELLDRRQRGADPGVVGDRPVLERDVEVDPHQHPLAVEVAQVPECPHSSLCTRSATRLE